MQYDSSSFACQFQNYTDIYDRIKDFVVDKSNFQTIKNFSENLRKYGNMFKLGLNNDKIGFKTSVFLNPTYYDGKNMWLVKAIDLNRGRCIKIADTTNGVKYTIKKFYEGIYRDFKNEKEEEDKNSSNLKIIKQHSNSDKEKKNIIHSDFRKYRTSCVLLQKYLEKPLLYWGRKFDVRIWVLYNHKECVYAFKEGHLKTSSLNYNINLTDSFIHLTNYSVQKYNKEFSKFECGNEVSFEEFQVNIYLNITIEMS
jgi:hypothetical protein